MHILARGHILQKLRLISGLTLFVFALTHFLNTAIGIVSIEQMDAVDGWRRLIIRSWPGTIILASALVVHVVLALWKLASRRTLQMPWWEAVQLALGLFIPFLLFPHIVNTRIASQHFGVFDNYLYELARLWPANAWLQSTLLVIVWVHGCIGIHFWLRLHTPYRAIQPVLLISAIAVPLLSLTGFMVSGRIVGSLLETPESVAQVRQLTRWPSATMEVTLNTLRGYSRLGYLAVLAVIVGVFAYRYFAWAAAPKVAITYAGGPTISVAKGPTLLEISRMSGIPHASVCGGRARCSTCRVRIEEGADTLLPPLFPEAITLAAIQAPANVRLACQIRPDKPIVVTRLLRPHNAGPQLANVAEADAAGSEKQLAVLYINMRDYGELMKRKLPYDVVFLLNQYFKAVGNAIRTQGGVIDKFVGDSMIAVFGHRRGIESGCRQALRAIRAIDLALDQVNSLLAPELGRPIEISAGLDAGSLVVGRIGYGETVDLTAIGPAIRSAADLQRLAREKGVQLVLSSAVARHAGWRPSQDRIHQVRLPDFDHPVEVVEVRRGRELTTAAAEGATRGEQNAPPSTPPSAQAGPRERA